MKKFSSLIILSSLVCIGALSKANTTSLVDPTRPANYVAKNQPESTVGNEEQAEQISEEKQESEVAIDFRLNAIKIGRHSQMAIINGEAINLGENLGSAKLIKIHSNSVDMIVNGEVVNISLLPDSIKKRSSK